MERKKTKSESFIFLLESLKLLPKFIIYMPKKTQAKNFTIPSTVINLFQEKISFQVKKQVQRDQTLQNPKKFVSKTTHIWTQFQ